MRSPFVEEWGIYHSTVIIHSSAYIRLTIGDKDMHNNCYNSDSDYQSSSLAFLELFSSP